MLLYGIMRVKYTSTAKCHSDWNFIPWHNIVDATIYCLRGNVLQAWTSTNGMTLGAPRFLDYLIHGNRIEEYRKILETIQWVCHWL